MSLDTRIVGTVFVKPTVGAVFNTTPDGTNRAVELTVFWVEI